MAQSIFLGPAGPSESLRSTEEKLNAEFARLYALYPAAAPPRETINLTVSSPAAAPDSPAVTQAKLNSNLRALCSAAGLPVATVTLEPRNPLHGGLTSVVGLQLTALFAALDSAGGSGDDEEEPLVQAEPLLLADFAGGTYSLDGEPSTPDTLFQDMGNKQYSSGLITPGEGYVVAVAGSGGGAALNRGVGLTATALAALPQEGYVVVLTLVTAVTITGSTGDTVSAGLFYDHVDDPEWNESWSFSYFLEYGGQELRESSLVTAFDNGSAYVWQPITGAGTYRLAVLLSAEEIAFSVNGGELVSSSPAAVQSNTAATLAGFALQSVAAPVGAASSTTLVDFAYYSLQDYDSGDLPALSALP